MLTEILGDSKTTEAFIWECVPVSLQTLHQTTFAFAVRPSQALERMPCDRRSFAEHFNQAEGKLVTSFWNLGGDSLLVTPVSDSASFNHISSFHRLARLEEKSIFWQHVVECMKMKLASSPRKLVWLSTNGLGVGWLHVRIDERPKYYGFAPFREVPAGMGVLNG